MKAFSSTFIFAFVVIVLGGLAYWDYNKSLEKEQKEAQAEKLIPTWSEAQVNELKIVRKNSEVHLKKEEGQWKILSPIVDKAENSSVNTMIRSMLSDSVKAVNVEGQINWGQYGFETAQRVVELINANTEKKSIHVSNKKTYDGQYYLRLDNSDKLLLASSSWDSWINKKVGEIRNKKIFDGSLSISKVHVKGKERLTIYKQKGVWGIEGNKDFKVDNSKVDSIINSIRNFRAIDVAAEEVSNKKKIEFRLNRPQLTLELEVEGKEKPIQLFVGREKKDGEDVFVYSSEKPFVYKTYKSVVNKWNFAKTDIKAEEKKEAKNEDEAQKALDNLNLSTGPGGQ